MSAPSRSKNVSRLFSAERREANQQLLTLPAGGAPSAGLVERVQALSRRTFEQAGAEETQFAAAPGVAGLYEKLGALEATVKNLHAVRRLESQMAAVGIEHLHQQRAFQASGPDTRTAVQRATDYDTVQRAKAMVNAETARRAAAKAAEEVTEKKMYEGFASNDHDDLWGSNGRDKIKAEFLDRQAKAAAKAKAAEEVTEK